MKIILKLTVVIFILSLLPTACDNRQNTGITVSEAWIRSAPSNAPALAAYMKISNNGDEKLKLINAAVAKGYDRVEFHQTSYVDGMMKMMKQDFILINPGEEVKFKPGGRHIMLVGPDKVPERGEAVVIYLEFANGKKITVAVPVK